MIIPGARQRLRVRRARNTSIGMLAQEAGISTVSTTWITPFDWLTLAMVTVDVPPLASVSVTLPSLFEMVSVSPSTVLSFLPSVRSAA